MRPAGSSLPAVLRRRDLTASLRAVLIAVALVAAVAIGLGLAFAGSSARLAEGVHVAGVDVGGLTTGDARTVLEARFEDLRDEPVTFRAAGREFHVTPAQLGVEVDWEAAVEAARREGEGFGPVRGLRRISTRIFGAEVLPRHAGSTTMR